MYYLINHNLKEIYFFNKRNDALKKIDTLNNPIIKQFMKVNNFHKKTYAITKMYNELFILKKLSIEDLLKTDIKQVFFN